jgi:hypothetical protein
MSLRRILRPLGVVCLVGACALIVSPRGDAGPLQCYSCCSHQVCPPYYNHCTEGPPKIKFKCGCPKPVCGPCTLEHYGYYPTCWRPWPFPPDLSHCPGPPPDALAATMHGAPVPGITVLEESSTPLAAPRKLEPPLTQSHSGDGGR